MVEKAVVLENSGEITDFDIVAMMLNDSIDSLVGKRLEDDEEHKKLCQLMETPQRSAMGLFVKGFLLGVAEAMDLDTKLWKECDSYLVSS